VAKGHGLWSARYEPPYYANLLSTFFTDCLITLLSQVAAWRFEDSKVRPKIRSLILSSLYSSDSSLYLTYMYLARSLGDMYLTVNYLKCAVYARNNYPFCVPLSFRVFLFPLAESPLAVTGAHVSSLSTAMAKRCFFYHRVT
jgi:hypothetical protein